jgi:hypothetical protein
VLSCRPRHGEFFPGFLARVADGTDEWRVIFRRHFGLLWSVFVRDFGQSASRGET